jgi:hypothetical protein
VLLPIVGKMLERTQMCVTLVHGFTVRYLSLYLRDCKTVASAWTVRVFNTCSRNKGYSSLLPRRTSWLRRVTSCRSCKIKILTTRRGKRQKSQYRLPALHVLTAKTKNRLDLLVRIECWILHLRILYFQLAERDQWHQPATIRRRSQDGAPCLGVVVVVVTMRKGMILATSDLAQARKTLHTVQSEQHQTILL